MPQMAPMNWLMLFIMFTFIFLIFNSMNYFSFNYKIKTLISTKSSMKPTFWKW
uniref:ATP synthase complex subunit 8 n=1 Tax=Agyrtodes labralis TaxID=701472 RepID=A0A0S2MPS9_9COLE|nr:ATP synthase F0 subunit 8 [Agyrtodes labralis]